MVVASASVEWRRTLAWGAAALTVYYSRFVVILMNGRLLLTDYAVYVTYENIVMQLAIAAGGLIVYGTTARIDAAPATRLTRLGRLAFGVCALVFGGAHFVYMKNTASLVPKWLPPTQEFWAYATGVGFVAAGVAILSGVQARLAAILLTGMLVSFGLLANGPVLLADPSSHWNWTESAVNLAVTGAAWVVADSLARPRGSWSASQNAVSIDGKIGTQGEGELQLAQGFSRIEIQRLRRAAPAEARRPTASSIFVTQITGCS
jgi:uncharacterized membrane protein YphA (DoxX/SURF4 family)